MPVSQIKIDKLNSYIGDVDCFICSSSYEERCLSIPLALNHNKINYVLVTENINFGSIISQNTSKIVSAYKEKARVIQLDVNKPIYCADNIKNALINCKANQASNYLIDITTFTHESLLILLRLLKDQVNIENTVKFVYTCAEDYSIGDKGDQKWLSKGVGEIRSILGYPGDILPTRKMHLILLVGFEVERAKEIIFSYEPYALSLGYGDAITSTAKNISMINFNAYQKILPLFENVETFNFSCNDPIQTKNQILKQVAKYPEHNTVIAAMNSKISTIGVALAALQDHRIQLCYATASQYNFANYSKPSDDCYIFEVDGFCNPG